MIKNYVLVALRNIRKHKFFAAINIIGLSLSMSVCLILILLVHSHFQYDTFHEKGDRIYRVTSFVAGQDGLFDDVYATSPLPIKESIIDQYAFIEGGTNLNYSFRGEIRSPHKILEIKSLFADESFFNVFDFELLEGDKSALNEPYSIVLGEEIAKKLFPNESPINQTIDFEDHGSYKVTGVVKNPPGRTHIQFEVLASFATIPLLVEKEIMDEDRLTWRSVWANYNYLVLTDNSQRTRTDQIINQLYSDNVELKEGQTGYTFRLQALDEITPGGIMSNEIAVRLPWFVLAFFVLLGFIVMVTATINYTNLSIAKSLSRTKEIGIRKVNGARRGQIIIQFLIESIVISFLSLISAIIIYKFLIKSFNEIWIFTQVGITLQDSWSTYIYFLAFTLFLGLITGIGPSLFLSRMDTIKSLKGSISKARNKNKILSLISGKKTLLSIQFSLSIIMLISILVLREQANFLVDSEYGFDDDKVYFIETQGYDPELIQTEFSSLPGVGEVTFTSHHPAVGRSIGRNAFRTSKDDKLTLYHFSVDPSYTDVMGLELVAGSSFPTNISYENEKFILINEQAVEVFGFESASAAIGEAITFDTTALTVFGVLKDYHWDPHMRSIRPLCLRIIPESYEYAYFRLSNIKAKDYDKAFEEKWVAFDPAREFKGGFLDAELDEVYRFFYDIGSILSFVALMAVVITSLGFLGMVSFEMKTKVKEIGIRKVLGAGFRSIALTMSKGFIVMIILTTLVAAPLALFINSMWVNEMANHAPLGVLNAIPALLIVAIICLSAILSQVWANVRKNPAETLRAE